MMSFRHHAQWSNLLGAEVADAPWEGNPAILDGPPQPKSVCYGPLAAAVPFIAAAAPYLSAATAGMTIIGGIAQSNAQRQAGEVAYQNAVMRNNMAQVQAQQLEQNAGQEQAAAQRKAIEERRKGMLLSSRMRAVMGASGGGIDENMLASLEGQGIYNSDVALYQGDERARGLTNQAAMTRWGGRAGVQQGAFERSSANSAADATLVGSIAKAGLSFASKYGFDTGGTQSNGMSTLSPGDTMTAWKNLPVSQRAPGFDDNWNAVA